MNVDCDSHCIPAEMLSSLESTGGIEGSYRVQREKDYISITIPSGAKRFIERSAYDLDLRKSVMKEAEIDVQLVLCEQNFGGCPDVPFKMNLPLCQIFNDKVSQIQKKHPEFVGCAEVPPQSPDAATVELRRAISDLGLKAVRIYGDWCGRNVEADEWWPFFEAVQELDVPVMIHTSGYSGYPRPSPFLPAAERWAYTGQASVLVGMAMQSIVAKGLIMYGVIKQYPHLKFVILESGVSWAPFLAHRLDGMLAYIKENMSLSYRFNAERPKISTNPSEYLRRNFWFALDDIREVEVEFLVRNLGMGERLTIQTDYPHTEGSLDLVRWVRQMNISDSDKERICGRNAAELLKLGQG